MIEWELEGKKSKGKDERTNGRTDENGAWLNGCEEPLINATSVLISILYTKINDIEFNLSYSSYKYFPRFHKKRASLPECSFEPDVFGDRRL